MAASSVAAQAAGEKIAIVTPYLAQPGTQFYVEAFQAKAKEFGWEVNVIDTKGDVAAAVGRIEDAANQKVSAIVINVDPSQVQAGLETAKAAGVPVFGMDAGATPLLVTNVTSNGYSMAADTASYVVNRIGGDLSSNAAPVGRLNGLLYNDRERSFSYTLNGTTCQLRGIFSDTFPRTVSRLSQVIPAGHTGWTQFSLAEEGALWGAVINASPPQRTSGFNQGHSLHKLTVTKSAQLIVPVLPPNC